MFSIPPRSPATRQVPTARNKGEGIDLYLVLEQNFLESNRIKMVVLKTKIKAHSDCDIQGHGYCLFLKIWVSGAEL